MFKKTTTGYAEVGVDELIFRETGTSNPTNGVAGYEEGAKFLVTDKASGKTVEFTNIGTTASSLWSAAGLIIKTVVAPVASFTDGGSTAGTLATFTIPKGAVVLRTLIDEIVGFAGDTSAVITVGDGTDVDRYNTGTPSVFATADTVDAGAVSGTAYHSAEKTVTLTITSATDFTAVKTNGLGSVRVTIAYLQGA